MFANFDLNVHWYSQYVVYKHVKLWLLLYDKPSPIGGGWCGGKFKYQLMSVQGRQTHYCNWQTLVTQKKMGTQALQSLWKRGYATPVLVCRLLICTFHEYCEYQWQNWRNLTITRGQGWAGVFLGPGVSRAQRSHQDPEWYNCAPRHPRHSHQ